MKNSTIVKFAALLVLAVLSHTAVAGDPGFDAQRFQHELDNKLDEQRQRNALRTIRITPDMPVNITKFYSEPGESKRDFIERIAPELRAYTMQHNVEVCGTLASDGTRYGLILMTINSAVICYANQHPMEMELTGETVHTHPRGGWHLLSERDKRLTGLDKYWVAAESWSQGDVDAGPGFLITPTKVKAQR